MPKVAKDKQAKIGCKGGNKFWYGYKKHVSVDIQSGINKLSSIIFLFRNLLTIMCIASLKAAYFALFHSHLTYGVALWGDASTSIKVFKLQKKVLRIMVKCNYQESCKPYFIELGIIPLPSLFIYASLIEIHAKRSELHNHFTRSGNLIHAPRYQLTKSLKNALDIKLYNNLPSSLKVLDNSGFKSKIKKCILRKGYYSTKEYFEDKKFLI